MEKLVDGMVICKKRIVICKKLYIVTAVGYLVDSLSRKRSNKNAQSDSQGYGNSPTDIVFQGQGRETVYPPRPPPRPKVRAGTQMTAKVT